MPVIFILNYWLIVIYLKTKNEFNTCKDGIGWKPKCVKVKAIDDVVNSFYKNILGETENIPSSNKVFNTGVIGVWITATFIALLLYVFLYKKEKITKMRINFITLIFQLCIYNKDDRTFKR